MDDPESQLNITEIYGQFKEWFKEGWPNSRLPIKNEVREYFEKLWGEPQRGVVWRGWRFRTLQEELSQGDAVVLDPQEDIVNYNKPPL